MAGLGWFRGPGRAAAAGVLLPFLTAALMATLLFEGAGRAEADGAREQEKIEDPPYATEFRVRVNAAIDRGAELLRKIQRPNGSWESQHNKEYPLAPTALVTLTLLNCGVKADDPSILRAFEFLKGVPPLKTYDAGLLLMAIAAKYEVARDGFEPDDPKRPGKTRTKSPCADLVSKDDLAWMKGAVDFLVNAQNSSGVWRYPEGVLDISNTEYALLGLQAANRCGSQVPVKVWPAALRFLLENQETSTRSVVYRGNEVRGRHRYQWREDALVRGFRYVPGWKPGALPTGSTTTSGIACLMICQSELWGSRQFDGNVVDATRRAVRDALAWMQEHYDVTANPVELAGAAIVGGGTPAFDRTKEWYLYYLYGLEAACDLARVRFLGERDWYLEGAEVILKLQQGDGGWGEVTDTCFALKFLKRATPRHGVPVITPFEKK